MKALGDYVHAAGLGFAMYTAESSETCGGYPASKGYETLDAQTFAEWGVDYLKVDGCGDNSYYPYGYNAMGAALEASGRDIVYSCSWPAYIGSDESVKPFNTFIMDGCNLWRNWDDIQCDAGSLMSIVDHWGQWGPVLAPWAGPGHWHDPVSSSANLGVPASFIATSSPDLFPRPLSPTSFPDLSLTSS